MVMPQEMLTLTNMGSELDTNATREITLEQAVAGLMSELPPAVQEFLRSPERDRVVIELSRKYNLHTDQAGEFQRAFLFMLLGISKPDEFIQTLRSMNLSSEAISGLTADINEQVFKKLQKVERESPPVPIQKPLNNTAVLPPPSFVPQPPAVVLPEPPRAAPPPPANLPGQEPFNPVPEPVPQPPAPIYVPPAPPQPAPIAPPAAPVAAPVPTPPPTPSAPPPTPQPAAHVEPHITRTMAEDMRALKSGVDPLAVAHHEGPAWAHEAPVAQAIPTPPVAAPQPYVPPAPQPRVEMPRPAPPPIAPVRPTPITGPGSANGEVKREYGLDPYREPIE